MGFVDGRNLENRSVALLKLEEDVPTLSQFQSSYDSLNAALAAEILARQNGDTTLSNGLSAHVATGVASAHPGQLNTESQIPNSSIGAHKLTFSVALAGHNHDGSYASLYHAATHAVGGSDPLTGTLSVNITGSAAFAYYAS